MEKEFIAAWQHCREQAANAGVRMRPIAPEDAIKAANRILSGSRTSDGFAELAKLHHLDWSLEALAVDKRYTALFTDAQANEALKRLMDAGYFQL